MTGGNCPSCGHEVALMATNCPNCGHGPLAGHYLRGMHLPPAERQKREEDAARVVGFLIMVVVGLGILFVLIALGLNVWERISKSISLPALPRSATPSPSSSNGSPSSG